MKLQQIRRLLVSLFPSARAWTNWIALWLFLILLICGLNPKVVQNNLNHVLISAFAALYFLNEWSKEILGKKEAQKK